VLPPEGTFYLWAKWASGDPDLQWNALADNGVFVMPGRVMNAPDYFRISLTASDDMVARALPAFARACAGPKHRRPPIPARAHCALSCVGLIGPGVSLHSPWDRLVAICGPRAQG
jgi:hypothetical protein